MKTKYTVICVLLCLSLIISVGFASWIITDTIIQEAEGTISAEKANREDFITISNPTKSLRYTNDGFMYYYDNGQKKFYNSIEVLVSFDVDKWMNLFGTTVDKIHIEVTLSLNTQAGKYNGYGLLDDMLSNNVKGNLCNITISLDASQLEQVNGVYKPYNMTVKFEFLNVKDDVFTKSDSILKKQNDMFKLHATISVASNN